MLLVLIVIVAYKMLPSLAGALSFYYYALTRPTICNRSFRIPLY